MMFLAQSGVHDSFIVQYTPLMILIVIIYFFVIKPRNAKEKKRKERRRQGLADPKYMEFYQEFKLHASSLKVNDYDTLVGFADMYRRQKRMRKIVYAGLMGLFAVPMLKISSLISNNILLLVAWTLLAGAAYSIWLIMKDKQLFDEAIDLYAKEKKYVQS